MDRSRTVGQRPVTFHAACAPDFTDGMRFGHAVDVLVSPRIDRRIRAVPLRANSGTSCRLAQKVRANPAPPHCRCVRRPGGVDEGPPVAQSLSWLLRVAQTVDIGWTAHETVGNTVTVFVHDNTGVQITRSRGICGGPNVHLHARPLTVGRREHVGIVGAAAIERFGTKIIVAETAPTVVVDLKVARRLGEAVTILNIMDDIRPVEQVRYRGGDIPGR